MREHILQAASTLYAERGYAAVSMRDVAAAVGVTPANLYHHFRDKEQLIRDSLVHALGQPMSRVDALTQLHGPPEDRLRQFVAWFAYLLSTDEVFMRLVLRELLDGNMDRQNQIADAVLKEPLATLRGLVADYAPGRNASQMAMAIIAQIIGLVQLRPLLPRLTAGELDASPEALAACIFNLLPSAAVGAPAGPAL